ncbi:SRPBCC family protein [Actinomadura gamaensis]|uniref:SRPBCC family protein n=1 Tax=Actinomadura gamaensis TaxID=1763541 RepID=A0ABV9TWV1_9ACTN
MAVRNVHERRIAAPVERVGALLETLASADDRFWPVENWPRMRLDGGLAVGSAGGHGPIRYTVAAYVPGRRVRFAFTAPRGFNGFHELSVRPVGDGAADATDAADASDAAAVADAAGFADAATMLRHTLAMTVTGPARLTWPLAYRWLHDALIEDCFDRVEQSCTGRIDAPARWSRRVRLLRSLASAPSPSGA